MFTLSLGQLAVRVKSVRHWGFAALYLAVAAMSLANVNVNYGYLEYQFSSLALIDLPALFITGPLLHMILIDSLPNKKVDIRRYWVHFILPGLVFLSLIPLFTGTLDVEYNHLFKVLKEKRLQFHDYLFGLGMLINLIYILLSIKHIYKLLSLEVLQEEIAVRHIAFIIGFSLIVVVLALLGIVTGEFFLLRLSAAIIIFGIWVIFILSHRNPNLYQSFILIVSQSKKSKSHLEGLDLDKLEKDLRFLMDKERVYTEDELSLSRLAQRLGISLHQLSQFLNRNYRKNFSTYINEYRIQEAQRLLKADPNQTIISIAFQVGFSSISSFNRGFKKVTGITPKAWRQSAMAKT